MSSGEDGRWDKVRRIYEIIGKLRGEPGCPWDKKQTPEKVQTYLVEEAHEAAAAIRSGHSREAADELGDLLFMVLFLVHLYEEKSEFRLEEVCDLIAEKMIRRHPHVFGDTVVGSAREVKDNWEKIKADEKASSNKPDSEVPESLPALMRAYRMISRLSHKNNADWNDLNARAELFAEKAGRLREGLIRDDAPPAEVFGDLLLDLVNLTRLKGYRAEDCLHERLKSLDHP